MRRPLLAACAALALASTGGAPPADGDDVGPLVRALWLVQRHGTDDAVDPRNDRRLKGTLSKALGKDSILTTFGVNGLMDPTTFDRLAGPDGRLDRTEARCVNE